MPKTTPLGLSSHTSAPGIVEWSVPSISERVPPVTREITFETLWGPSIGSGPVKVAVSPCPMPKRSKLWKRLRPRFSPNSGVIR